MPVLTGYQIFENNALNDDATTVFGGTTYKAMSFTPGRAHDIYGVELKLIRTGACGVVTVRLYATDTNGKPTGDALATGTIAQASIGLSSAMVQCLFSAPTRLDNDKYIIVLSAQAAYVGARYQQTGSYTAGSAWSSTNSGTTWTEAATEDLIFREYGLPTPLYGTSKVQLYPGEDGTYKQLVPKMSSGSNAASVPTYHWQCVADLANSPDELSSIVAYSLHEWLYTKDILDEFMSGDDDGAAGSLSGTEALWKCNVAGLWGDGTSFSSELTVNDLLRSPTDNVFWKFCGNPRISKVASIESDTALTLSAAPTLGNVSITPDSHFREAWYFTPQPDDADMEAQKGWYPTNCLGGTWTWTNGSAYVTGSGGDALSKLTHVVGVGNVTFPCAILKSPGSHNARFVYEVEDDDTIKLQYAWPYATHIDATGTTRFIAWIQKDDLTDSDKATQWCAPTKKDSFLLKKTFNKGDIKEVAVVYRVAVESEDTALTGTAQPLLYLNGTEVDGTEVTVTAGDFATKREIIARPGGGSFTIDDFEDLEVGIILGNISDPNVEGYVACTQIYLEVSMASVPDYITERQTLGLTEHGQMTFINKMDEHGRPVFDNGMTMFLLQKVYKSKIMTPSWIRPLVIPIGRRVKSLLRRGGASGYTGGYRARS